MDKFFTRRGKHVFLYSTDNPNEELRDFQPQTFGTSQFAFVSITPPLSYKEVKNTLLRLGYAELSTSEFINRLAEVTGLRKLLGRKG